MVRSEFRLVLLVLILCVPQLFAPLLTCQLKIFQTRLEPTVHAIIVFIVVQGFCIAFTVSFSQLGTQASNPLDKALGKSTGCAHGVHLGWVQPSYLGLCWCFLFHDTPVATLETHHHAPFSLTGWMDGWTGAFVQTETSCLADLSCFLRLPSHLNAEKTSRG